MWWGSRLAVDSDFRRIGAIGATLIRLAVCSAHAMGCTELSRPCAGAERTAVPSDALGDAGGGRSARPAASRRCAPTSTSIRRVRRPRSAMSRCARRPEMDAARIRRARRARCAKASASRPRPTSASSPSGLGLRGAAVRCRRRLRGDSRRRRPSAVCDRGLHQRLRRRRSLVCGLVRRDGECLGHRRDGRPADRRRRRDLGARASMQAEAILDGMKAASDAYGVPIVGGHSNLRNAARPARRRRARPRGARLLTSFDARPGDALVAAVDHRGALSRAVRQLAGGARRAAGAAAR